MNYSREWATSLTEEDMPSGDDPDKIIITRKCVMCFECGDVIYIGERAHYSFYVFGKAFIGKYICMTCGDRFEEMWK